MSDLKENTKNETFDSEELKRYLFFEMSESERQRLEAQFFENDELFYELLDAENDLTDRYARNELSKEDAKRFESSLAKSPERRAKLANAKSLQSFIEGETKQPESLRIGIGTATLWERIAGFFGLNAVGFPYATAALVLLLLTGIGFLIYERSKDAQELARLRERESEQSAELQKKEETLQEQIKTVAERERELQAELAEKDTQTDILNEQMQHEQTEKTRLESEMENLKRRVNLPAQPIAPTIATVILAPIGGKGGGDAKIVSIGQNITTVSANLQIPSDSAAVTFSVRLNSAALAGNLKINQTKSGSKFIRIVFPASKLSSENENLLSVTGSNGSHYNYVLRRRK